MRKFDELRERDSLSPQRDDFKEKEQRWDYGDHFMKDYLKDLNKKDKEKGTPYCPPYYDYAY